MTKKQNKPFALRMPTDLQEKVYKRAAAQNQSVNQTINRLLNNSLMTERIYFEMQYLNKGERFIFKDDETRQQNGEILAAPIYRYVSIHPENGNFICTLAGNINKQFKFSEVFYKPIFRI